MNDFANDIPVSLASAAHNGTSFVPEKRAEQEREGYASTLQADYESLLKLCDTPEKRQAMETEFARYRDGYRKHTIGWLSARSRMVSTMIAGPSGFPVARQEKYGTWAHNKLNALIAFRNRALDAIRKTLCPELRPIMSGDGDAIDRLKEKIAQAERLQEVMREANKIIRRAPKNEWTPKKETELKALGLSHVRAEELFKPDFCGRIGFPDYALTNNNANIRRMRERMKVIEQTKDAPQTVKEGTAAKVEDCPAENRVRLFFPGKPSEDVRGKLKGRGFRWTPSLGCWQAYRNHNSLTLANEVAGA